MLVFSHSGLEIVFYIIAQQKEKPASFDDAGFFIISVFMRLE